MLVLYYFLNLRVFHKASKKEIVFKAIFVTVSTAAVASAIALIAQ